MEGTASNIKRIQKGLYQYVEEDRPVWRVLQGGAISGRIQLSNVEEDRPVSRVLQVQGRRDVHSGTGLKRIDPFRGYCKIFEHEYTACRIWLKRIDP